MKKILVTGSSGQLGQCLKQLLLSATDISCYFATREDLDITNSDEIQRFFSEHNFDYCINTAAYTKAINNRKPPPPLLKRLHTTTIATTA